MTSYQRFSNLIKLKFCTLEKLVESVFRTKNKSQKIIL